MDSSSPLSSPPPSSLFNDFDEIAVLPPSLPYSAPTPSRSRTRTHSSPPSALPIPPPSYQSGTSQQISVPAEPDSIEVSGVPEVSEVSEIPETIPDAPSTPSKAEQPQDHEDSKLPVLPRQPRSGSLRKVSGEKTPCTPRATITRSGRLVAPRRLDPFTEEPRPVKASPSESAAAKRRKREATRWKTDSVLSSAKSPLGNFDIRALLCNPQAWELLSREEQKEVLSLFPSNQHIIDPDTDKSRPDIASLKNDDNFRHDCARYQTNLQGGFHDKAWLEEAFEAHELRKNGFFDQFITEAFESDWNIQLPDEYKQSMNSSTGSSAEAKTSKEEGDTTMLGGLETQNVYNKERDALVNRTKSEDDETHKDS